METQNPCWFVEMIIRMAQELLRAGKYKEVALKCLFSHNHGHSGWTDQVNKIFFWPVNEKEKEISTLLKEINLQTAQGLIESLKPTAEPYEFIDIEVVVVCIFRLKGDAPRELVARLEEIIEECAKLGLEKNYAENALKKLHENIT